MHSNINGSAGMTPDTTMAPSSNGYGSDAWANMSPYSQSPYNNSPMNEYNSWTGYMPHGLPSESLARMPPPVPTQQAHQVVQTAPSPHMGHHGLPMLTTAWPSQLTNPTPPSASSYSAPPSTMAPVTSSQPVETPRAVPAPPEKARKTLSVEQKRAMCQFFEDHPKMRQADIGAAFGVERSTVSKVLRQKDQYLKRDPESDSVAAKRIKGKNPDFDRTLSNYIRRQQQTGKDMKDEEIIDRAKKFAYASGHQDSFLNSLTTSWLQKFKQKHGIAPSRLQRRASETNIPDSARLSNSRPLLRKKPSSGVISPASPTGQMSPLSESRSDEELPNEGLGFDFTYRSIASQSTTSLTNDAVTSSFSAGTMSPTGTFTFSPDPNTGGFAVDQKLQLHPSGMEDHHREKRSNTFPSLSVDAVTKPMDIEPITPRHPSSSAMGLPSSLESPAQDMQQNPFAIDTAMTASPTLRRSSSNSSMTGRSTATTATGPNSASVDSSPVSPSQEDARRAANTLLSYIQSVSPSGHFDQAEYNTIVQLTKKLQMSQHPLSRPSIGGLSRIPEGDSEMPISTEVVMESG